jgi:ribonuclease HI
MNVFTDGACSNNGKNNAIAGIGIFFSDNDNRNISEKLDKKLKQTNNVAELTAIIRAINLIKNDLDNGLKYNIYTDSNYCILCAEKYEEWIKKICIIKNLDLVKELYNLNQKYENLNILYVKAHTGNTDNISYGNEQADKLANLAIGKDIQNIKNYINISYNLKEKAKELGAKWDKDKKSWYYLNNLEENNKIKLNELKTEINEKNYININYNSKEKAKELGAKWDKEKKSWYYLNNLEENNKIKLNELEIKK